MSKRPWSKSYCKELVRVESRRIWQEAEETRRIGQEAEETGKIKQRPVVERAELKEAPVDEFPENQLTISVQEFVELKKKVDLMAEKIERLSEALVSDKSLIFPLEEYKEEYRSKLVAVLKTKLHCSERERGLALKKYFKSSCFPGHTKKAIKESPILDVIREAWGSLYEDIDHFQTHMVTEFYKILDNKRRVENIKKRKERERLRLAVEGEDTTDWE